LLKQPTGTIFSRYTPGTWGKLLCFECQVGAPEFPDFHYTSLGGALDVSSFDEFTDALSKMEGDSSITYAVTVDGTSRWGTYDKGDKFVIYEKADLEKIRDAITTAIDL
jgi:hypothetical protein